MLSPNEVKLLRVFEHFEFGELNKTVVSRQMEISSDYAAHLLGDMERGGYLTQSAPGRYRLTPKGAAALQQVLFKIQDTLLRKIERARFLRTVVNGNINKLSDLMEETFQTRSLKSG